MTKVCSVWSTPDLWSVWSQFLLFATKLPQSHTCFDSRTSSWEKDQFGSNRESLVLGTEKKFSPFFHRLLTKFLIEVFSKTVKKFQCNANSRVHDFWQTCFLISADFNKKNSYIRTHFLNTLLTSVKIFT